MGDLHSQIMNIQVDPKRMAVGIEDAVFNRKDSYMKTLEMAYKIGHRDARHDAAQLATKGKTDE